MNLKNVTIKTRLMLTLGLMAVLLVALGTMGLNGMSTSNESLNSVYENRMIPSGQISEIGRRVMENRILVLYMRLHPTSDVIAENSAKIEENIAEITRIWKAYLDTRMTDEEKRLADEWGAARAHFVKDGLLAAVAAFRAGRIEEANRIGDEVISQAYQPVKDGADALLALQLEEGKRLYTSAAQSYATIRNVSVASITFGVLLAAVVGLFLLRAISRPLNAAVALAGNIASGNLDNAIEIKSHDETGQLLSALKRMQDALLERMTADRKTANENLRIRSALDNTTTNVMVADNDGNIIYMNKAVQDMMRIAEADIRKDLPQFSASGLLGANFDRFHKNPAHQRQMLSALSGTYRTSIKIGGRTFRLTANPVRNDAGERLGSCVEWVDATAEVKVQDEVDTLVAGAVAGDFTRRIDLSGKEGFMQKLSSGMNQLMDVISSGLTEVVRVFGALSKGDLTEQMTGDYQGTFGKVKQDSNNTVQKLQEVALEIRQSATTIAGASQEISVGNSDLSQRTEEQASSLEETASSLEELTSTVKQNADNARQANQLASSARDLAEKGGTVVASAVGAMSEINSSSKKIADIIGVIDEIAFQTNLLALNAAVEAARAGEQGRGFAVVATEVRNLAQRSATAAREIKDLIMDSVGKVEDGSRLVDESGKTLEEIVGGVKKVSDIIAEIAAASQQQAAGIDQVNKAVMQMDEMTQQNAALVEQTAAASKAMEEQARTLNELIQFFKIGAQAQARVGTAVATGPAVSTRSPAAKPAKPARATRVAKARTAPADGEDGEWTEF